MLTTCLLYYTDTRTCYSCTANEASSQCESDPSLVENGVLSCRRDLCTTVRVEEWPSRQVKSFYRGCDGRTQVFDRNHCIIGNDERTCFSSCQGILCNDGNGLDADREFLRYDNVNLVSTTTSSSCKNVVHTVSAALITFPLWVM